jgi:hypothetical protein
MSFLLSLMFSLQQNQRTRGSARKPGEVAQTMYINVSKCKTDKKKILHC